jgi:hypothetical protein
VSAHPPDFGDWCERLGHAIGEGRFFEDPAFWREHVEACATCRTRVESAFDLHSYARERDREAPPAKDPPADVEARVSEMHRRLEAAHRRRNATLGVVLLVCGGIAAFLWASRERGPTATDDPVAYSRRLWLRVFGEGSTPDYGLLLRDAALRDEYLAALDHPSSLVRRTALTALTSTGVELPAERLRRTLAEWREDLETPIEVASAGATDRWIAEALAKRRTATLRAALKGIEYQTARSGRVVDPAVLVPFLRDPDDEARKHAIQALRHDPGFVPGAEVEDVVRSDPAAEVRVLAIGFLLAKRDVAGAEWVVAHLGTARDFEVERQVLPGLLRRVPRIPYSDQRVTSLDVPVGLALAHARGRVAAGRTEVPAPLVLRAIQGADRDDHEALAGLAAQADWRSIRTDLQRTWERDRPAPRLAEILAGWDERAADESRLDLALDLCEAERTLALRAIALRLAVNERPSIRRRAEALLRDWPER